MHDYRIETRFLTQTGSLMFQSQSDLSLRSTRAVLNMVFLYYLFLYGISIHIVATQDISITRKRQPFRPDYNYEPETNLYYKEHKTPLTWEDAGDLCEIEGASLALPKSEMEVEYLTKHMSPGAPYYWVGLSDKITEGRFLSRNGKSAHYTNWNKGEPNAASESENCVMMYTHGKWNDNDCDQKFRFICTSDSETKYFPTCETYDGNYFFHTEAKKCYKLHMAPKNWWDAYRVCEHELAVLGIINSEEEAGIYNTSLRRYPAHTLRGSFDKTFIWVGFNDFIVPGDFTTIKGMSLSESGYNNFFENPDVPEDYDDEDVSDEDKHCGSMMRNGALAAQNCKTRAWFMCEKSLSQSPNLLASKN